MTSTTTKAASAVVHSGELAVRLAPAQPSAPTAPNGFSGQPAARTRQRPPPPPHPVKSMQEAFVESLAEVTAGTLAMKPILRDGDAKARRERLLEEDTAEGPPAALWRHRPGQHCHELQRLLAQIAFGVYLLLQGMANSNAHVVAILQSHIDEVDEFLKVSLEDLDLATQDLRTRLECLQLPLQNRAAFEKMLEDRDFRLHIVEGNLRIEHILARTNTFLAQAVQDVAQGQLATTEFSTYLENEEQGSWRAQRPDMEDIYELMYGNAESWLLAFNELDQKNKELDVLSSRLADMVTEMDKCAGEVSRRTRFSVKPYSSPKASQHSPRASLDSAILSPQDGTPPFSPIAQVPQSPPRLSLRFSAIGGLSPNFLDLGSEGSFLGTDVLLSSFQYIPPAESAHPVAEANRTETRETKTETHTSSEVEANSPKEIQIKSEPESQSQPLPETRLGKEHAVSAQSTPQEHKAETLSVSQPRSLSLSKKAAHDSEDASNISSTVDTERDGSKVVDAHSAAAVVSAEEDDDFDDDLDDDLDGDLDDGLDDDIDDDESITVEANVVQIPLRIEVASPAPVAAPQIETKQSSEAESAGEETLYLLQPRTYTPQPPSPLPSPRMPERPERSQAPKSPALHSQPPDRSDPPRLVVSHSEERLSYQIPASPAVIGQAQALHFRPASTQFRDSKYGPSTRQSRQVSTASPSISESSSVTVEMEGSKPRKRASLRDRVSLRTNPPDAIHVPPPNAPQLQRPVFASPSTYQNYQTFTGPDPYTPDVAPRQSYSELSVPNVANNGLGFSPPVIPAIIPSPQSDQQYFRPVQASPHSPLQQRPHTAGLPSRPYHLRNAPSTMGMSMLSSVTTMTQDSTTGRTVKKKRSAFGWLKKAFTLDEEERAAFDQRKQAQERNLYYDGKSPKYLDGKRIR